MDQARTWVPRTVALLGFAMYALAAPPGPYWLDSAELSASGVGLGVAHPTGFPLYAALVKLASLVPIGELAFRVNLLSAVCAALAMLWVARLVCDVCRGDAAALIGGAAAATALGLSLTFFRQATVAEVYAPNAAVLAAALLLLHRVASGEGAASGLALAAVCGLGLAVHVTFAFVGVPVAVLLGVRLYRGARWVLIAPALTLLVALGLYAYLPVRAAAEPHPAVEWAQTDRADALVGHVSGERVRDAYADDIGATSPVVWTVAATRVATSIGEQLVFVCLGAVVGAVLMLWQRRGRWVGAALVFVAIADASYAVWINPMGQGDLQNGVVLSLALCALAGAGVALFARLFGRAAPFGGAVAALVMVAPPALVTWSGHAWAASSGDLPRAVAEAGLDATPSRGVAVVESDSMAAAATWLTAIEGARPDVVVMVRQRDGAVPPVDRPVTWELGAIPPPQGRDLVVGAPLSKLVPAGQGGGDPASAARALAELFRDPSWRDPAARRALAHQLNLLGRVAFARGRFDFAAGIYDAAIGVAPRFARVLINRGAVAAALGDLEGAARFTERGLAEEPNHRVGLTNLARYYINLGRDGAARDVVERLRALDPADPSGLALYGVLEARAGRVDHAAELVERALALDPDNRDARTLERQLR